MLFLLFRLGGDRYALDAGRVEEVLPLVQLKPIPGAPAGVVGIFNLRGTAVPVLDLSLLALGRTARTVMSTRIILVRYPEDKADGRVLGLIAENATEMMRREPSDFVDAGVSNGYAPYLGPVTQDGRGLVQLIAVDRLLTQSVRDVLFQDASAP
jgi:chemotaxis-related protein WspB